VWGLWVALVDFLPQVGGALAGIPTVLFAATHSLTAGIVTAVVFLVYTQRPFSRSRPPQRFRPSSGI
jgi:predicted PurR-regulated permease PerM